MSPPYQPSLVIYSVCSYSSFLHLSSYVLSLLDLNQHLFGSSLVYSQPPDSLPEILQAVLCHPAGKTRSFGSQYRQLESNEQNAMQLCCSDLCCIQPFTFISLYINKLILVSKQFLLKLFPYFEQLVTPHKCNFRNPQF